MNIEKFIEFVYNNDGTIKNLYNVLGVNNNTTKDELENAILNNNISFYKAKKEDIEMATAILSNEMTKKIYDDLLLAYNPNLENNISKNSELESVDGLLQDEKRRVELILAKINDIYAKIEKEGIPINVETNNDFIIKRFHRNSSEWHEVYPLVEESVTQIDVLKVDEYYVYKIKNFDRIDTIISKDLFLDFNKEQTIYGDWISPCDKVDLIKKNLKGIILSIDNDTSLCDYYYRETSDTFNNLYGTDKIESLYEYRPSSPMRLGSFNLEKKHIWLPALLLKDNYYNRDSSFGGTYIYTKNNWYEGIIKNNYIYEVNAKLLQLGREMYLDLKEHDPENAELVISLAFPQYADEIMLEPVQKTIKY